MKAPAPLPDDRPAQADRVANYLDTHPYSTQKEIDVVCDTGCISKVLSDMRRPQPIGLGYGLAYDWRDVLCADGSRTRQVRTYALLHRPKTRQHDLFKTA